MRDRKNAEMMAALARDDLVTLEELGRSSRASDRAFGFSAQQAVEKALKAWLAFVGFDYPKIHDLEELCSLLDEQRQVIPEAFRQLAYLTDYAVLLRYTLSEELTRRIDRPAVLAQVRQLVEYVERLTADAKPGAE
jgi:HEPN domain-containing protein